jgi:hypothetical protein
MVDRHDIRIVGSFFLVVQKTNPSTENEGSGESLMWELMNATSLPKGFDYTASPPPPLAYFPYLKK